MNKKREEIIEEEVYTLMCSSCSKAVFCHEECVTCDSFDDEVQHRMSLKNVSFKDFHECDVHVGDKVTLLKKAYGFCGIDRAYLIDVIYIGKGRWGYEFDYNSMLRSFGPIRIRNPQCVLFKKKGGK